MKEIFESKLEKRIAAFLFFFFCILYFLINIKFMNYLSNSYEELKNFSPFSGYSYFLLNIFNFDPTMYSHGVSPIHPFKNFMTKGLEFIFTIFNIDSILGKNIVILFIQTIINALNVVLIFLIYRCLKVNLITSTILSVLFGVAAYSIVTVLIPDSYTYAQFIIILSLYFLLKSPTIKNKIVKVILAIINFGITSTNLIPYIFGLGIKIWDNARIKSSILRILKYIVVIGMGCIGVSVVQYLLFDTYWFGNISSNMEKGAFSYTENFALDKHWYSFYLLFINPIIMPDIELIDYYLMAFVSKWNLVGNLAFYILPLISVLIFCFGCFKNFKKKELWILLGYIGFAILLHLKVGFGLATIKYDLFLYAGHYLAPLLILLGLFTTNVKHFYMKYINIFFIAVVLMISVNNITKYNNFYDYMTMSFDKVSTEYMSLDSNKEWEFFSNKEGFKIVRVNLDLEEKNYLVLNGTFKLKNYNADYFFEENLSDIYVNGYLYISIANEDSGWEETHIPSVEEIKQYFEIKDYKLVY